MIKQTKDYEMIKSMIIDDTEMFDRISDDYTDLSKIDISQSIWLGYFKDGICQGLLSAHEENAIVLNIHIHIPIKYRGKHSVEICTRLIDYLYKNSDERFVKINIKVPVIYPDVIKFAKKCGFEKEGIDRKSFKKNGLFHDRIIMGKIIK